MSATKRIGKVIRGRQLAYAWMFLSYSEYLGKTADYLKDNNSGRAVCHFTNTQIKNSPKYHDLKYRLSSHLYKKHPVKDNITINEKDYF